MILKQKRVGTVLPMTSLVSQTARAGSFAAGEKLLDWLVASHQKAWQVLPLHQTQLEEGSETKHIRSPYKGYGIGLDPRFHGSRVTNGQLSKFIQANQDWLPNYALFCSLRDHFGTDNWIKWPSNIRHRYPKSIKKWQKQLASQINYHMRIQAQLHAAYQRLYQKAGEKDIALIGDLPLYLSLHSPLVWQFQHLFEINAAGQLQRVSGIPVGPKSHFGRQVWGHPLYKWQDQSLIGEIEALFAIRLKYLAGLFNWVRLDHAKGLFVYGAMNPTSSQADQYLKGPGTQFLTAMIHFAHRYHLNIYAEDTGDNLKDLRKCLKLHHIPGIKIFKYAYDPVKQKFINQYLEINKYHHNTFAYTTTHDTQTLVSYLKQLSTSEIHLLCQKIAISQPLTIKQLAKAIRNKIIQSPAKMVLIPLQDWLYTTDRINVPGSERETDDPNWRYRMALPIEELPTDLYQPPA